MKSNGYNHKKIEQKWQKVWARGGYKLWASEEKSKKEKKYVLDMFPYPSGEGLHVGHLLGYIGSDILSRYYRMRGFNVLHPMGWDAFGLPAENYAIKHKVHPETAVKKNIKNFKRQLYAPGFSYDWSREINTTDPDYYKWTQWIFLQLFKKGLAYEANIPVNWCPKDKTVLANEEVVDGCCDRCGTSVEKKNLRQWVLKITAYADRLVNDLDALDWPEKVKELQRNWIGRSEGALIKFDVRRPASEDSHRSSVIGHPTFVEVFTTRPDTLAGATYVVVAPEHSLVASLLEIKNEKSKIKNAEEIKQYIAWAKNRSDRERQENKEKTGVELKGVKAVNPLNNEELPIWVADYVLGSYGTGAIMAVPAHDERDRAFAEKFHLPIVDRPLLSKDEAIKKTGSKKTVQYKLRDWIFSRQRYWGEPIPLVFCGNCAEDAKKARKQESKKATYSEGELPNPGWIAIPENELPLKLPKVKSYEPTGTGESPLANIKKWVETTCPKCGGPARRETNTMPQWAGSCWYYLAYGLGMKNLKLKMKNEGLGIFKDSINQWLPVDLYIGGVEHAVLHLLYARFWHKFLYDIGVVGTVEPFQKLMNQGLMLSADGQKMSKSKGNVVSPDEMIRLFGADALRMYEMFMGPFEDAKFWDPNGIVGVSRFLNRAWNFVVGNKETEESHDRALRALHRTIKKVTDDIEHFRFNTAVSAMMIFLNDAEKLPLARTDALLFVKLLAPFAPHIAEELAQLLGVEKLLDYEWWPAHDPALAEDDAFDLVIQVNGRTRAVVRAVKGIDEATARKVALESDAVKPWITGVIKKVIYVPNRLISLIVG